MSVLARYVKDPDAILDYTIDWSSWLATGDTISASVWTADEGITVEDGDTFDDDSTTVWLSGGTAGAVYRVVNHVTTTGGREDDRTLEIQVEER